jgi:NADH:ubiquinone oxidoreductase subunit 2 (subunit N)
VLIPYSGEVALIKLAGYTLAGSWLKRVYGSRFNHFLFGILRFVAGAFIWFVMAAVLEGVFSNNPSTADNVALFVSRLIVWVALIALVFQINQAQDSRVSNQRFWLYALAGITWSYCLDGLVALLRMAMPGFGTMNWC